MRRGLFGAIAVADPVHDELRLTIPVREALVRLGNMCELRGADTIALPGPSSVMRPPSLSRRWESYQVWRVTLGGVVPSDLTLCLIGDGLDLHRGVRLANEPHYPGEWAKSGVPWWELGEWVPCPACGAALVWYEAGYVPGYRVCAGRLHHHAQLAEDGRRARLVR